MKRTLIMMILVMAGIMGLQAQTLKKSNAPRKALAAANAIEAGANQMWWGYGDEGDEVNGIGTGVAETYNCAIYIPGTNAALRGKTLKAIRFANLAKNAKYAKVWVAKTLPGAINQNNTLELVSLSTLEEGTNDVALSKNLTIGAEGVYLGITFSITKLETEGDQYPVAVSGSGMPNALFLKTSRNLTEWGAYPQNGRLFLQALIEGDFPYEVAASPAGTPDAYLGANTEGQLQMSITNLGSAKLTDIDYTVTNGGTTSEEKHIVLDAPLSYGGMANATISLVGDAKSGHSTRTIKITKVNGVANQAGADASASVGITTLAKIVNHGFVVEEFTGTGCGWCPRGLVGMEKMREKYGDQFVGIGYHGYNSDDPMYLPSSNYTIAFSGAPSCEVNRFYGIVDPYYGAADDIIDLCEEQLSLPAMVGLDVKGKWNADFTEIEATATIEGITDGGDFQIEYMLIADGLTGEASAWKQQNYYNGQGGLPEDLAFLTNAGSSYYTVFNDVCLATSVVNRSNKATAPGKVADGQVVTNTYTLKMPTKQVLLDAIDRDKVAVVAVLINKADKTVANAAKFYMGNAKDESLADGTYYFQNVATGKFLAAGHSWGTRSIVNEAGLDFIVAAADGKYTLDSQVSNGGDSHFLGTNLFVDGPAFGWTLAPVAEGVYTISDGTQYIGVGDNDETALVAEAGESAQWRVVTYDERIAALAAATEENPVNATFAVRYANFGRNDQRMNGSWETWSETANGGTNFAITGGNNENNCAESYHAKFSISQTISGLPNGVYAMTAQGYYRQDGSDNANLPYFFINGKKATFPKMAGTENNMADASVSFTNGLYTIEPLMVCVTDGTITLGAKNDVNQELWCIWDNFQLTYYGNDVKVFDEQIAVNRIVGMGYGVTEAVADFTEAKKFLGVDELTTDMLRIENPDGELISDYAPFDGWFDGEGVATTWGDNTKINVKFFQAIPDGVFTICDMNGADEVGKTYTVKWRLVNGEKSVRYTINVTFIEKPVLDLKFSDLTVKNEVTSAFVSTTGSCYEGMSADVDVPALLASVEASSLDDVTIYAVQSDGSLDDNYKLGTTDGWRNAAGDWQGWGADARFYVKADFAREAGQLYEVGGMEGTTNEPASYTATYAFVKNGTKDAAVLKVTLTYQVPEGIESLSLQPETTTVYNLNGQKVEKVRKGLYIQNGKKIVVK